MNICVPTVLYAAETWGMSLDVRRRLNMLEMEKNACEVWWE